jgi:hypothetical protein
MKLLLVLAAVCGVALMVAGCGAPALSSPGHIGKWGGESGKVLAVITVAGEPGHYTAGCQYLMYDTGALTKVTFSGGKVDALGNVTFDDQGDQRLTLGSVGDGVLTATILDGNTAVQMSK